MRIEQEKKKKALKFKRVVVTLALASVYRVATSFLEPPSRLPIFSSHIEKHAVSSASSDVRSAGTSTSFAGVSLTTWVTRGAAEEMRRSAIDSRSPRAADGTYVEYTLFVALYTPDRVSSDGGLVSVPDLSKNNPNG